MEFKVIKGEDAADVAVEYDGELLNPNYYRIVEGGKVELTQDGRQYVKSKSKRAQQGPGSDLTFFS